MYCQPVLVITLAALWTNCHKSTISCDWMELMVRRSLQLHNRTKRMHVIMHFSSWTDPERKKMQREGCEIEFQIGPCNMLSETATWNGHVPVCSFRHCARRVCYWTAAARRQIKVWREIYIPGGPPLFLSLRPSEISAFPRDLTCFPLWQHNVAGWPDETEFELQIKFDRHWTLLEKWRFHKNRDRS